jgi:repressor LexA
MSELTKRQRQIVDFIEREHQDTGMTPTFREIAGHFGFASPGTVVDHVQALRKKGVLLGNTRKARSLRVQSSIQTLRRSVVNVLLFGSIPAGLGADREQEPDGCVTVDVETIGFKPTRNTFALRVTGDSMIGKHICDGDIVVLEHGPDPRPGQVVAALIDRKSTLKTFIVRNSKPFLKAENPKYPDLIPSDELMIQGVFRALIRKAREMSKL